MAHRHNPLAPHQTIFSSSDRAEAEKVSDALRYAGLHPLPLPTLPRRGRYRVELPIEEMKAAREILAGFQDEHINL